MSDASPQEVKLTEDLIEYVKAVALKEAKKLCPKHINYDDVIQEVVLHLLSKPPKYDPSKGAALKTLLYTIVHRRVLKYVGRECRHASRFKQVEERKPDSDEEKEGKLVEPRAGTGSARAKMIGLQDAEDADDASPRGEAIERRPVDLTEKGSSVEDVLEFIDNEDSRRLCRMFIECGGNRSEVARRLGVAERTVRYRLELLAPKLRAAGFDPGFTPLPKKEKISNDDDDND